jgi:hypothetical protein
MAKALESMEELMAQKRAIEAKIEKRRELDTAQKNEALIKKIKAAGLYDLDAPELLKALESLKALSAKPKEVTTSE